MKKKTSKFWNFSKFFHSLTSSPNNNGGTLFLSYNYSFSMIWPSPFFSIHDYSLPNGIDPSTQPITKRGYSLPVLLLVLAMKILNLDPISNESDQVPWGIWFLGSPRWDLRLCIPHPYTYYYKKVIVSCEKCLIRLSIMHTLLRSQTQ